MDLFTIAASITLDTTEYEKNLKSAASESKTVKSAMESLVTPVDKIKSAFSAITHPVESVKSSFDKVASAAQSFLHPIETIKGKISEASTALETKRNKLSALSAAYDSSKAKVASLTEEFNKSVKESGASSEKTQELARKLREAEAASEQAKGDLDAYAASVKKTGKETDETAQKTSGFADVLKKGLATAAKVGAAAVAAASAAVVALTKQSLDGYAEYEQLAGGVETLFKTSSDVVMEYANNAYKTSGLSANKYMETVTSFSASLLQSLGGDTEAAAKYADMAVTDMADNSNKFGTSMESVENAYQGFAKQNFTMLDNLKLGYGGTKEEMERLLSDAEKLSGQKFDISSYADIVEAIHVVQTEMGITGTTAEEAASTIQGSVLATKAAWANLVSGLGDENADLGQLVGNLVTSVETAAGNIIPRVQQILSGMGQAIQALAPIIAEQIPALVEGVLPPILNAGMQLMGALGQGLLDNLPTIIDAAVEIVESLINGMVEALPQIVESTVEIIASLASGISKFLPELLPTIVEVVMQIVETLIDNVDMLIDAAIEIIIALAEGLISALPKLLEKAPEIVAKLVEAVIRNAPKLLNAATKLIFSLVDGIIDNLPNIAKSALQIVDTVKNTILELPKMALSWGKDLIDNFVQGIKNTIGKVTNAVSSVASTVKNFIGFSEPEKGPLSNFHTYAPDMMKLFAQGIRDNENLITDQIEKSFDFGEQTIGVSASYIGQKNSPQGNQYGSGLGLSPINITINGARYNDERSLAKAVAEELQSMMERRNAIYA